MPLLAGRLESLAVEAIAIVDGQRASAFAASLGVQGRRH